ncbi:penicillin-binding protein 2 [soil metagenome]
MSDLGWAGLLWLMVVAAGLVFVAVNRRRRVEPISRNLPVIGVAFVAALFVLAIQAARMQVFQQRVFARRIGIDPADGEVLANPRLSIGDTTRMRGSISDASGREIAWSEDTGAFVRRRYGSADVAHVAGYFSPVLYGKDGLELAVDEALTGGLSRSVVEHLLDALNIGGRGRENVQLTIVSEVQREAQSLLQGHIGAAVVVNVKSGAVIALASNPVVDPSRLAAVDAAEIEAATAYWTELVDDERRPLLRRSTLGLYTPGSTFKVVTAAAAIDSAVATPDSIYEDDGVFTVDGHTLIELNRPDDTVTQWSLTEGLAYSLNIVFAQVGMELGPETLTRYAESFGFGESVPFDIPVANSQVSSSDDFLESQPALVDTAFGQGELLTTPLHMAMVAAAIANDGVLMRPYLIDQYLDPNGGVLEARTPEIWKRSVPAGTARQVAQMMVVAVEGGNSGGAYVPGLTIGGKTGTAETGDGDPHAWFIGFGGNPAPEYAVSVVLEHGGSGGGIPSTIGGSLLGLAINSRVS